MSEPTPNETPEQAEAIIRQVEVWAKEHGMTLEDVADLIRVHGSKALHFDEPPPKP